MGINLKQNIPLALMALIGLLAITALWHGMGFSDSEFSSAEVVVVPAGTNPLQSGFITPASCGVLVCDAKGICTTVDYGHAEWGGACEPPPPPPPPPSFDFSLSNGGNQSVVQGNSVTNSITAALVTGATQSVSFSVVSGLPSGATASFSPVSCDPTCSTTLTINTLASTPAGSYTIAVRGTAGSLTRDTSFTLTVASPPDLVTTNFSRTGSLVTGSTLTFSGDVTNQGGSTAPASTARFCVDNPNCLTTTVGGVWLNPDQPVSSLIAGATSAFFSRQWTATAGNHTAYFCADVTQVVSESNENDNCGSISFTVNGAPSAVNLQAVQPDYCSVGFASAILSWQFTDPDGDPQSAKQVQVDDEPTFTPPYVDDSGKITGSAGAILEYSPPSGKLTFNNTYYWRVMVWDSQGAESSWIEYNDPSDPDRDGNSRTFTTPRHPYPTIDPSWTPQSPSTNEITLFTDQSTVYGNATTSSWSWSFQEGSPLSSNLQNPSSVFVSTGQKTITLSVTDSDGYSCQAQETLLVSLPLPDWKEIPPF